MTTRATITAKSSSVKRADVRQAGACLGVLACTATIGLAQTACQKENIKVKGTPLNTLLAAGQASPAGIPVNLPGALAAARTWFQSRGEIDLVINSDQISPTSSLQLVNSTNGVPLINTASGTLAQKMDPASREQISSWALQDTGYSFDLTIYPLDPNFAGKFIYGANRLTLNVDDQTTPKAAQQTVNMHDFPYFSPLYATFASNDEQLEGFQGELVTVSGPFVNNGTYELSSGFIGVVNR